MKKIEEVYKALVRYGVGDYVKVKDDDTLVCVDELTADAVTRALRKDPDNVMGKANAYKSFEDGKTIVKILEIDVL